MSFGVARTKRKCRHYDIEENGAGSGQNSGRTLGGKGGRERKHTATLRQSTWENVQYIFIWVYSAMKVCFFFYPKFIFMRVLSRAYR